MRALVCALCVAVMLQCASATRNYTLLTDVNCWHPPHSKIAHVGIVRQESCREVCDKTDLCDMVYQYRYFDKYKTLRSCFTMESISSCIRGESPETTQFEGVWEAWLATPNKLETPKKEAPASSLS